MSDRFFEVACVAGKAKVLTAAMMVALLFILVDARSAHAATFEVDSTANTDTRACTAAANDTINFAIPDDPGIPGLEVKTISPTSELHPTLEPYKRSSPRTCAPPSRRVGRKSYIRVPS